MSAIKYIIFFLLILPTTTFAQTLGNYEVSPTCDLTINFPFDRTNIIATAVSFNWYKGENASSTYTYGGISGGVGSSYNTILQSGAIVLSTTSSSITYSANGMTASPNLGNGYYFAETNNIPNGQGKIYYQFNKTSSSTCTAFNSNDPVLSLTPQPWLRIVSPQNNLITNNTQNDTITITLQVNSGTSTATSTTLRFFSQFQELSPVTFPITQSGLSTFDYELNLPVFSDYIQYSADMYVNSSSTLQTPTNNITINNDTGSISLYSKEDCNLSLFDLSTWWECTTGLVSYLLIPPAGSLNALVWYTGFASSTPATTYLNEQTYFAQTTLNSVGTTSVASLNMSIPINIAGHATLTLPIVSFTEFDTTLGNADELFRGVCLASLVIFALSIYLGNVQRAFRTIAYRGLDT